MVLKIITTDRGDFVDTFDDGEPPIRRIVVVLVDDPAIPLDDPCVCREMLLSWQAGKEPYCGICGKRVPVRALPSCRGK